MLKSGHQIELAVILSMTMPHAPQRVGEVISSHTERVEVQCYELHSPPPLGALLRIGSPPVYAIVREIWNEPVDPSRPLTTRGSDLETEAEVYANNPQLASVLTTRFSAAVVGYGGGTGIQYGVPPTPPNLHAFVFCCDDSEVASFVVQVRFLRLLTADRTLTSDLAITAFLRRSAETVNDKRAFLVRAGRTLAAEMIGDGPRLHTILREIAG